MDAMDRWFALEMARVQQSIVRMPRHLVELLLDPEPRAETKGGEPYRFDPEALHRFGDGLPILTRHFLRVPVFFYADKEAPDSAYVADVHAADALRFHGLVPENRRMHEGKLWLGIALARDIANRYPTLFQFVLL